MDPVSKSMSIVPKNVNTTLFEKLKRGPRLSKIDKKWESIKDDIHTVYIVQMNTLPITMMLIQEKYGFKASPRKWKSKLKEWQFKKYLSDHEMKIVVAKAEKRSREGKKTVFRHPGSKITEEKIKNFKRRRPFINSETIPPSAATPPCISYSTPRSDDDSSLIINPVMTMEETQKDDYWNSKASFADVSGLEHGSSCNCSEVLFSSTIKEPPSTPALVQKLNRPETHEPFAEVALSEICARSSTQTNAQTSCDMVHEIERARIIIGEEPTQNYSPSQYESPYPTRNTRLGGLSIDWKGWNLAVNQPLANPLRQLTKKMENLTEVWSQRNIADESQNRDNPKIALCNAIKAYLDDPHNHLANPNLIFDQAIALLGELQGALAQSTIKFVKKLVEELTDRDQHLRTVYLNNLAIPAYRKLGNGRQQRSNLTYHFAVMLQKSGQYEEALKILHKILCEHLQANTALQNFDWTSIVFCIALLVRSLTTLGQNRVQQIAMTKLSLLKMTVETRTTAPEYLTKFPQIWFEVMAFALFTSVIQETQVAEDIFSFGLETADKLCETMTHSYMKAIAVCWNTQHHNLQIDRMSFVTFLLSYFNKIYPGSLGLWVRRAREALQDEVENEQSKQNFQEADLLLLMIIYSQNEAQLAVEVGELEEFYEPPSLQILPIETQRPSSLEPIPHMHRASFGVNEQASMTRYGLGANYMPSSSYGTTISEIKIPELDPTWYNIL